jgi:phosphatidate cytidylyltransferase
MKERPLLRWRFISAAVILAILLALLWLDYQVGPPGAWLTPLLLAMALAAAQELLDMTSGRGLRPVGWTVYAGVTMVVLAATLPSLLSRGNGDAPSLETAIDAHFGLLGLPFAALAVGIALVMLGEVVRYQQPGEVLASVAFSIFVLVYVAVPLSFLAALRFLGDGQLGDGQLGHGQLGMAALLCMLLVVKLSDTGQYAWGRMLGRNKLAPRLSPGKTIEGAVGGLLTACPVAWLSLTFLVPLLAPRAKLEIAWWEAILFGLLVALAGMLGDLGLSLVKRDTGRKDSSRWLPGLGGVLDVLDSVLLAAPAAYFWWVLQL